MRQAAIAFSFVVVAACAAGPEPVGDGAEIVAADLHDPDALVRLRTAFVASNPGYDVAYHAGVRQLAPHGVDRVCFVQGPAEVIDRQQAPSVGDIVLLRAGERYQLDAPGTVDLLAFSPPAPLPRELPAIVRPDWDQRITDTPGGCATEGDAYRRILLTWKPEVGPYVLHQLNAHRVRIHDSFSHYHPKDGGFDEFYLVQQAPPGARLLTSTHVAAIERRDVDARLAKTLLETHELRAGQLIYLPRGTVHRGLGGALVQVISVPGFVPKREIGVDHHLWAINKQLGLAGDGAIPFHLVAARTAVVK